MTVTHWEGYLAAVFYMALFAAALLAKLDSWQAWSTACSGWFRSRLAIALVRALIPVVETTVIVTLLVSERLGLFVAASALAALGAGAAYLSVRGVRSQCACFGAASPSRIGLGLTLRNMVLSSIALAVGVLADTASYSPLVMLPTALLVMTLFLFAQEQRSLPHHVTRPFR